MKKKLKGTKGITLIALVLTIIVLLILAGVTIATLTGENGILSQAQVSKDSTERAEEKERIQLEVLGSYENDGTLSISNLKSNILAHIEGATHDNANNFPLTVTYTATGHAYKVESDGTVSKKVGVNLNKSSTTLQIVDGVKGEEQLEVELVGITGTVNWSSSDPTKVSVTSLEDTTKVIIRAEAVTTENVEITASLGGENSICTVKVEEKKSITGITFDSTNPSEVNVGSTAQIKVSEIIPEDATEILNWSIAEEDADKATITEVSADGKTATIRGDSDGTVTIIVQNTKKTLTNNTTSITVKSPQYLSIANEGDYVDINLPYVDKSGKNLTGWRILRKFGSGDSCSIRLISSGHPMTFYYPGGSSTTTLSYLNNLKINITKASSATTVGFQSIGFGNGDETSYNLEARLGNSDIFGSARAPISSDFNGVTNNELVYKKNTVYWLGNNITNVMQFMNDRGTVLTTSSEGTRGVRVVINLNYGVQILDGAGTMSKPYKLKGILYP